MDLVQFLVGQRLYRTSRLPAYDQWDLLRRVQALLPAVDSISTMGQAAGSTLERLASLMGPLTEVDDEDFTRISEACLRSCEVSLDGETWAAADSSISVGDLLQIISQVVVINLAPLYALERPEFRSEASGASYAAVTLPHGRDWLMRPVLRQMCTYGQLRDGSLHLEHVAEMNDAISVADENQYRAQKAAEKR